MQTTLILGAGFSKCASLPTQNEFPDYFLSDELSDSPLHKAISVIIREYLIDVFGWCEGGIFPTMEDYFTCLDLSANIGHNLGDNKYTPRKLRAIRRVTIYRIFQILDHQYKRSNAIEIFLSDLTQKNKVNYVVTNWDIVLERVLMDLGINQINYGFECYDWNSPSMKKNVAGDVLISKLHGSSNWIYCESCTKIYYDLYRKLALHEMVGISPSDFSLFKGRADIANKSKLDIISHNKKCPYCKSKFSLSTHIATFSYKKSYRTFAYPAIWHTAQMNLSESDEWIFIGYSLPDADYEFKHLLKSAELSCNVRPRIKIILKDDQRAAERYLKFFGSRLLTKNIFQNGLEGYVKEVLKIT
jgi:NAD-dependent SIR2 family protein deacetylase